MRSALVDTGFPVGNPQVGRRTDRSPVGQGEEERARRRRPDSGRQATERFADVAG